MHKQECPVQVICSRDVEAVLIQGYYAQTILSLYKKIKQTRKDMQKTRVPVVANTHVSLQFCGKAALKRRITLSYEYRASEGKIHFMHFFTKKSNTRVNR